MRIAVIGGGISGISVARMLKEVADVTVYERNSNVGGLIRCEELPAGLYHLLGGHVFNAQSPDVSAWFWRHFDREGEFHHLTRNARILLGNSQVGYPLENHLYQLPPAQCAAVVQDLIAIAQDAGRTPPANFRDFLLGTFGPTLCEAYFFPYNAKLWRCDLSSIPLGWLEGKLPMPLVADILRANVLRQAEKGMVHSQFFYPRHGGSQFIIDRLATGLSLRLSTEVSRLIRTADGCWRVNDEPTAYDRVVYTGDVRALGRMLGASDTPPELGRLQALRTRGITNAFCHCDSTAISWLYVPDAGYRANRIIYTGAFSPENNRTGRMTCVVEFAYGESGAAIAGDLHRMPGNLELIATNSVADAYVIQEHDTRESIAQLKATLKARGLWLLGRFAEWEYYNMDKCIGAAMQLAGEMGGRSWCLDGRCPPAESKLR